MSNIGNTYGKFSATLCGVALTCIVAVLNSSSFAQNA